MRLLFVLWLLAMSVFATSPAFAHASLLSSDPADGAVLTTAPAVLSLTFNEPVAPTAFGLVGPDGAALAAGKVTAGGNSLSVPMPAATGRGTYALSWRVISTDGHPVGGTVLFSIGAPSAGHVPEAAEAVDWPVRIGIWVSRLVTYAGMFVGIGGVAFLALVGGNRRSRWLRAALVAALLALPVDAAFEGLDALGRPVTALLDTEVWWEGMQPSYGTFIGLAAVALLLALLGTLMRRRIGATAALLGLLLAGAAFAATGHASAADPQWLTRPAVALHVVTVMFWIGALLPLAGLLRAAPEAAVPALRRFSALIPWAVAMLAASGLALALIQIAEPGELLTTDYGRVFVAKMALVAILLLLAAYNRWRLTRPVLADDAAAKRRLVSAIAFELVLALAIFGVVALWRFTTPPRTLIEAASVPAIVHISNSDGMAMITFSPGRSGPVEASIDFMAADMAAPPPRELTLDIGNSARGIEPIQRKAVLGDDGSWHVPNLILPAGGQWEIELDALVSDFKMVELSGSVDVQP